MDYELVTIPGVDPSWEVVHEIRAIVRRGRNEVEETITGWPIEEKKKLFRVVKLVCENERVKDLNKVQVDYGENPKPVDDRLAIREMTPSQSGVRIFFFYEPTPEETVVCIHTYTKNSGKQVQQDKAFQRARILRDEYLRERGLA